MSLKKCRQCGEIKSTDQFRSYYTGSGTYRTCKTCEKINSRAKYLRRKGDRLSPSEKDELEAINELYDMQRKCGLKPPSTRADSTPLMDVINKHKQKYFEQASADGPEALTYWLDAPLTETPEYYLDVVYEQLKKQYRPIVGLERETKLPLYDDTHVELLDKILERFNNYEDIYYTEED